MNASAEDLRLVRLRRELVAAGAFGDGVDTFGYAPLTELVQPSLTSGQRIGASLALLCELASLVDNSCWSDVVASSFAKEARTLARAGALADASIADAVEALYSSEEGFFLALQKVYSSHIVGTGR